MLGLGMPEALVLALLLAGVAWLLYTIIRRPEVFRRLLADMAERRRRRREAMGKVVGGAAKAGLTVFKLLRR